MADQMTDEEREGLRERAARAARPNRVGLATEPVDSAEALAKLLIQKGVITEREYLIALADGAEAQREVRDAKADRLMRARAAPAAERGGGAGVGDEPGRTPPGSESGPGRKPAL